MPSARALLTRSSLPLALLLSIPFLARPAAADCEVSPAPPPPQPCDPGGDLSEISIFDCDFDPFTFGSFVSVGSGGPSSATVVARRTVFEGQSSAEISSCDISNPESQEQLLLNADARAVAASDAFEVGVAVSDFVPGRGDGFSGTLEAANAAAAGSFVSFSGLGPNDDLDALIHLSGSFSGTGGRSTVQLAVRDLEGRTLGFVFAASEAPPTIDGQPPKSTWRFLSCPDPRNDPGCDLGTIEDRFSDWPGSFDLPVKVPATVGNGLWVELKGEASQREDATPGQTLSLAFDNTAVVDIQPPEGASVTLASGQVFGDAPPPPPERPFEVSTLTESGGFDEERLEGSGDTPLTADSQTDAASIVSRGIAGSGRLLAEAAASQDCFFGNASGNGELRWFDEVTASGAESYRMEIELAGAAALESLIGSEFSGAVRTGYFLQVFADSARRDVRGRYEIDRLEGGDGSCSPQQIQVGDACFSLDSEELDFPFEVTGSGELGEGPVVVAFDVPLPDGQQVVLSFEVGVFASVDLPFGSSGGSACEDLQAWIDLGTEGRYVRFLGITGATTQGQPDESFEIQSARSYDYSQPRELVAALPEPGAGAAALVVLASLVVLRRRR